MAQEHLCTPVLVYLEKMLQDEPLVAKFRFDIAENELSGVGILTTSIFYELVMAKVSTNLGIRAALTADL